MISVTEKACKRLHEIAASENIETLCVRVKVKGGGCAGFSYDMHFEDESFDLDESITIDGIEFLVDALSLQYLDECEIDYMREGLVDGFKFNNPNVKSTCGCGQSFDA